MTEKVPGCDVDIVTGHVKGEFGVFVDGERIFSRLEQRRYPEFEDILLAFPEDSVPFQLWLEEQSANSD